MESANVFYSTNKDYDDLTDEELIAIIKSGDKQAFDYLINRYKELVNIKVSKYFIIGAEKDDIVQEGLIGLFKAIKSYKPDMKNSFKSFPARPTKGFPSLSSSAPGASPISIILAFGEPSEKTIFVRVLQSSQPTQFFARASSSKSAAFISFYTLFQIRRAMKRFYHREFSRLLHPKAGLCLIA